MILKTIAASAAFAGLLIAGAPAVLAQQKTPVLRYGHMNSPTHIVNLGGQRLKAAMEKASGGGVQIDLFPSAQLGENSAVLEQLNVRVKKVNLRGRRPAAAISRARLALCWPLT